MSEQTKVDGVVEAVRVVAQGLMDGEALGATPLAINTLTKAKRVLDELEDTSEEYKFLSELVERLGVAVLDTPNDLGLLIGLGAHMPVIDLEMPKTLNKLTMELMEQYSVLIPTEAGDMVKMGTIISTLKQMSRKLERQKDAAKNANLDTKDIDETLTSITQQRKKMTESILKEALDIPEIPSNGKLTKEV